MLKEDKEPTVKDVDTVHGRLQAYRSRGFLGLPQTRAKRLDCGHQWSGCPFKEDRRSGPPKCTLTPPNPSVYHNLVTGLDGQLTFWRPAEIDCGKCGNGENGVETKKDDPLLCAILTNSSHGCDRSHCLN